MVSVADQAIQDDAARVGVDSVSGRGTEGSPGTVTAATRDRRDVGAIGPRCARGAALHVGVLAVGFNTFRALCGRTGRTSGRLGVTATPGRGEPRCLRGGGGEIGPVAPRTTLTGRGTFGQARTKDRQTPVTAAAFRRTGLGRAIINLVSICRSMGPTRTRQPGVKEVARRTRSWCWIASAGGSRTLSSCPGIAPDAIAAR